MEVSNKQVMLMGDFNYPNINWSSQCVQDNASSEAQLFVDCLDDCFLTHHVKSPTRLDAILPGTRSSKLKLQPHLNQVIIT